MNTYAGYTLADLRTTSLTGLDFAQAFMEDFTDWETRHFKQLNRAIQRELLNVLRDKVTNLSISSHGIVSNKLYYYAQG